MSGEGFEGKRQVPWWLCEASETMKPFDLNVIHETLVGEKYSARNSLRPVNFYCWAPQGRSAQIAGDFNHWFPVPMHRRVDGWWSAQVLLSHGHHRYRFLVDGESRLDPQALGVDRDERGEEVSLVAVS